ncbi:hypothetical protein Smar_1496 [Staphylothermus marinus F1]|uniref:Uncharacterized protein n=1 Tax=Staphylothermus marinus (strain ATCC 43588 / DSM 3639 / JCM 9404 / F1) TaxID=399550 RepID=A3DPM5_STAMF|nr:hypothetical protein [Staphylothermus marinus]ABN70585.1 hypothetical protein Smar_1496 [Staphylothermus marinus F1]
MFNLLRKHVLKYMILVFILLLIISQSTHVFSAYREEYSIKEQGNLYFLDVNINIYRIGNYGVISIYLKPDGVYAYGITVLKDPDKEAYSMYLMLGTQNEWYYLGDSDEPNLKFRLFIDVNISRAVVVYDNCSIREYNLSYIPKLKELYVSSFNITGKQADYPRFIINSLKAGVLNTSINDLKDYYCIPDINTILNKSTGTPVIITATNTTTQNSNTTNTVTGKKPSLNTWVLPTIIALTLAFLIIIYFYKKKGYS